MTAEVSSVPEMLNVKNSLFLVVDVQEKLMPVISEHEKVVSNVIKLIKFAEIVNLPVIYTEQYKLGCTIPKIKNELSGTGPIYKKEFGCFQNDGFKEYIKKFDLSSLIIAGVEAHVCVSQTALWALEKYNVHVVSDAVSSRTHENRKVGLERMRDRGTVITSTEMVMFELLKKADTEEFKKALKLIK